MIAKSTKFLLLELQYCSAFKHYVELNCKKWSADEIKNVRVFWTIACSLERNGDLLKLCTEFCNYVLTP